MAREVLCFVGGFAILLANTADILWTALGTHGGGPITGPLLKLAWNAAGALHRHRPHHRLLSFTGGLLVTALLIFWSGMLWCGWFVVFTADPASIVNAQTHAPADPVGRLYFTAYTIATMGNGDFMPQSSLWRLVTSVMALTGIGTLTLVITFLMQILRAVVEERQLAAYISDLGATPMGIITRSWDGEKFDHLSEHLVELARLVPLYTEQHLAYPVLQYYHSEHERTAATLRVTALYELTFLLRRGVAEPACLPPMVILPMESALHGFAEVIKQQFVTPADEAPAAPQLRLLRDLGIPTVDDATWARAVEESAETRRFYAGLLQDDGWPWERVWGGGDTQKSTPGPLREA